LEPAGRVRAKVCLYCGKPLSHFKHTTAKYCTNSHRQIAYERRKRAAQLAAQRATAERLEPKPRLRPLIEALIDSDESQRPNAFLEIAKAGRILP
jgi:hypothetical protein